MTYANEKFAVSRAPYRQISASESDGGREVGRDPRDLSLELLTALNGEISPIKAIRAKCIECCCGNQTEVRKCIAIDCSLWPFRMGVNPYHGKIR